MRMGKISLTAPIATALIKARARRGDEVAVHTPRGVEIIEVLSVSYPSPAARYEDGAPSVQSADLRITGPSRALTRCQVLRETNSGFMEGGHDRLRLNLDPHQCSSNISSGRRAAITKLRV